MIKFYISDLLGKFKKSQRWLSLETGIRSTTINNYYFETIKRINKDDLDSIMKAFKSLDESIKLSDIVDFIEETEETLD